MSGGVQLGQDQVSHSTAKTGNSPDRFFDAPASGAAKRSGRLTHTRATPLSQPAVSPVFEAMQSFLYDRA